MVLNQKKLTQILLSAPREADYTQSNLKTAFLGIERN